VVDGEVVDDEPTIDKPVGFLRLPKPLRFKPEGQIPYDIKC